MTIAVGLLLGAGLVLVVSPWFWPRVATPANRRRGPLAALERRMRQAGLASTSPVVLVVVDVLLGAAAGAVAFALMPVVALAVVAGLAAAAIPVASISGRARRRRAAARAAWPDLVDHLVASLRSGQSLTAAIGGLALVGVPE
ncbi:MAG TPA: type II secretion system protein F, partial [Pseudolysinimonas sp.]|nr:type II secretion system protein F [Pseudolysinimonas sp.]